MENAESLTADTGGGDPINEGVQQQGGQEDWRASLPESVREWDEAKNSDSPEKFYDQMANLRSMMGKSIRIPSPDAGTEAREQFLNKLKEVDGVMARPEGEDGLKAFLESLPASDKKVLYDQLKGSEELTQPEIEAQLEQIENERREGFEALRKEWGNGYDAKISQAKNTVRMLNDRMGDNRLVSVLDKTGAALNPEMIAVFAKIGDMLGEKPTINGEGSNTFAMTPAEARDAIAEIEQNPNFWGGTGTDLKEQERLVAKRAELAAIAYAE